MSNLGCELGGGNCSCEFCTHPSIVCQHHYLHTLLTLTLRPEEDTVIPPSLSKSVLCHSLGSETVVFDMVVPM